MPKNIAVTRNSVVPGVLVRGVDLWDKHVSIHHHLIVYFYK